MDERSISVFFLLFFLLVFYKRKKATHPLHWLYSVTTRDWRKHCNNSDSLAHRMRGPIEAVGEEILGPISVTECPRRFSPSAPPMRVTRPRTCSRPGFKLIDQWAGQIRFCSVTPDPALPGSQHQVFALAGIRGSLPSTAFPFHKWWFLLWALVTTGSAFSVLVEFSEYRDCRHDINL